MMRQQMHSMQTWGEFLVPRHCDDCGRSLAPSGMDFIGQWNETFFRPLMQSLNRTWGGILDPWMETMRSGGRRTMWSHRSHDCGCRDCDCDDCVRDDCHCRCCIGDVDLLVYARLGEQRVVPLVIENNRRRERQVRLELSGWTTHSGKSVDKVVSSTLQPVDAFTLKSCEERVAILLVNAIGIQAGNAAGETDSTRIQELRDVDDCEVFYADLRVEGCDIRPIRIALALLPRDCASYEIDCRCGCC